jgi:hypothetical protein
MIVRESYRDRPIFTRHGGAYDRGCMDSYYRRGFNPHYYTGTSFNSTRIDLEDMSVEEVCAYTQGYNDNEHDMNWKDYT